MRKMTQQDSRAQMVAAPRWVSLRAFCAASAFHFLACGQASNLAQPSPINSQHHFGGPLVGQLSRNTLMAPNYPGQHSQVFLIIWANSSVPECAGLRETTEKGLLISGSQVRALLGSPLFSEQVRRNRCSAVRQTDASWSYSSSCRPDVLKLNVSDSGKSIGAASLFRMVSPSYSTVPPTSHWPVFT